MNRPLLWAALAFAGGIGAGEFSSIALALFTGLVLLTGYLAPHSLPYRDGFLVALIFFVVGAAWMAIRASERHPDALAHYAAAHPNAPYTLHGVVVDAPVFASDTEYMAVRVKVTHGTAGLQSIPAPAGVLLRWSNPTQALHPGEHIRMTGNLSAVMGEVNLGSRGMEDYYRRYGYHSTLRARSDGVARQSSPTFHLRYWTSRLRQWEADVFEKTAPPSARPLLRAVWLGDKSGLSTASYAPYLQTGTAHILAVSGVHIGILYLTLQLALRGILPHRKARAAVILLCVIIFALVTGARTPILRATIMLGLYLWAEFLDREPDAPTALSLAALFFLGYNPALLGDGGFALSFSSLGSLLIFSQPLAERLSALPPSLRQNVAATAGVSILPLPVTASTFHVLSLIGPLCNLLVIPLLTALLWLCLLTILVAPLSLDAASIFGHAAAPVVWAIQTIASWGATIPFGHRTVTSPTWIATIAYGLMALLVYRAIILPTNARRSLIYAGTCLVVAGLLWQPFFRPATMDFLDVGHGDATFIRTPEGITLLVDGGNRNDYIDQGGRTVVPWLLDQGIDRLDYVVATHPDRDHVGGLLAVVDTLGVGEVLLWPWPSEDEDARALVSHCAANEVPIRRVGSGDSLRWGATSIDLLHPPDDATLSSFNDQSLVLHVQWPGMNALLTGDIEAPAERMLLPHVPLIDILKVPHHGSHTSSTDAFLRATAPQMAIVSTRAGRTREAMAPSVIARYEAHAIPLFRTDYHGGVQLRIVDGAPQIRTARETRGYSLAPTGP